MARNVILLRGNAREEAGIANEAITPGMLVELRSDGKYQKQATGGAAAAAIFARAQTEHDGAGVDDDIAADDEVTVIFAEKGAKINAVASGTIDVGEFVQSAGGGMVAAFDSGEILGYAASAADLSGDVDRVEIIVI